MEFVGKDARLMEELLEFCRRWEEKNPEEELVFLFLPKNDPVKREALLRAYLDVALRREQT